LYLNHHLAIRELVRLINDYALADFPEDRFADAESEIKSAYEVIYRSSYNIDFMSPLKIVISNERVEGSPQGLIESLGFHPGLTPVRKIKRLGVRTMSDLNCGRYLNLECGCSKKCKMISRSRAANVADGNHSERPYCGRVRGTMMKY
jgi:hypothetical protein